MHTEFSASSGTPRHFDIVIVGAGPAGLSLAQALKPLSLRVALIEQSQRDSLAAPAFDGREIALTQHSVRLMKQLDMWDRLPQQAVSPLCDARVMNGVDPFAMTISHQDAPASAASGAPAQLGFLVGNHHIRKAAFDAVQPLDGSALLAATSADDGNMAGVWLFAGQAVQTVHGHGTSRAPNGCAQVVLANGQVLTSDLLVAADSRHSSTRRAWGIAADMHDFGRSMLLCAMTHPVPHHHTAWEWFGYGQTLALLPMNPCPDTGMHRSSVVLTLPSSDMQAVQGLAEPAFNAEMTRRFADRLGSLTLASTRHVYPLVAVYPRRLVGPRFACVGDAACGMHPVTAHGFNLGLKSVDSLVAELTRGRQLGRALDDATVLARYERTHWLASRPTYLATQLVTRLYTDEAAPARVLRQAALRIGQQLAPFRRAVAASLTGA